MSILMIESQEKRYEDNIGEVVSEVLENRDKRLILIAGPSCAGKTTTTRKITEGITAAGRRALSVSIDDFYLNYEDAPVREDGTKDLETIYSIDLDYLHSFLTDLMAGKTAYLPKYTFVNKCRDEKYTPVSISGDDVVILEGLHALNPLIYSGYVDEKNLVRVYLYAESFHDNDPRFLRRMVRDYHHRGADAELTFSMWDDVKEGERLYIDPFINYADFKINTYFTYERGVHVLDVRMILSQVKEDSIYYKKACRIIRSLEDEEPIDHSLVPMTSVLREFMKERYE